MFSNFYSIQFVFTFDLFLSIHSRITVEGHDQSMGEKQPLDYILQNNRAPNPPSGCTAGLQGHPGECDMGTAMGLVPPVSLPLVIQCITRATKVVIIIWYFQLQYVQW